MATHNYESLLSGLREVFCSGKTKDSQWRKKQLNGMLKLLDENRERFCDALKQDLGKPRFETLAAEINYCRNDLLYCLENIDDWVKPEKVKKNLLHLLDKAYIRREPLGVVLIISPWNFPVHLLFLPMIGALAAGNCVVLKPSELSCHTADLVQELVPRYFDNEAVRCVLGGVPETTALLKERWDYIFYTGSSNVGKVVMKAAAEFLTPVTLELGGKSPVYVDKNADLSCVANRILWGKFINAGQACIAPDYVLCSKETQDVLVQKMKDTLQMFYPEGPENSPDFGRIINDRQFKRLLAILKSTGGTVAMGGESNGDERYIAPTILKDVSLTDTIMHDEIFGPILPICPVKDEDEAIRYIQEGPKPLAFYIFTNNNSLVEKLLNNIQSGGCCVNNTYFQGALPSLPFGGVGKSGMGVYHGKYSFETFSHKRSVMHCGLNMEFFNKTALYPPFTKRKIQLILWILGRGVRRYRYLPFLSVFLFGALSAGILKVYLSADKGLF